ncbi:MAG: lipopolysaccharide biosynthesis protein [Candidatus Bathyarchaeia archaeon]
MRRFFRQFLTATAVSILNKAVGVLTSIALARLLLPEGYGLYTLVFSIVLLANSFADIGVFQAVTKYAAETEEDGDIVWTGFVIDGAVTITLFFLCLLLASPIGHWMDKPISNLVILCSLYLVPCSLDIYNARLLARRRIELLSMLSLAYTLLSALFSICLVYSGHGIIGAIAGYIIAKTIITVVTIRLGWVRGRIDRSWAKRLLSFGIFSYVSMLSSVIIGHVDRIVLGFFVPSDALGSYSVAKGSAGLIEYIPSAFAGVAFPVVSRAQAENDMPRLKKVYEAGFFGCGIYAMAATMGALVFASPLIRWVFGMKYMGAIPVFQVLIFSSMATCLLSVFLMMLNATGKPSLVAQISIFQSLIGLAILPALAWMMGNIGIALADIIVQTIGTVFGYRAVTKSTGLKVKFSLESVSSFFRLLVQQAGFEEK